MKNQQFGAGIWHFATYLDRYATDGYGEPRSVIDCIALAGQVRDLSVVDINYPYFGGRFTHKDIKTALDKVGLGVIGITPEIYTREFSVWLIGFVTKSSSRSATQGSTSGPDCGQLEPDGFPI